MNPSMPSAGARSGAPSAAPTTPPAYDVALIGGGMVGALVATVLARRGLRTVVLESRAEGVEQKWTVGEALTEGTSVFLRHELGMTDWLRDNAFRKFGFDFVVQPEGQRPATLDECHEMLLSLVPLERIRGAGRRLVPTFHVERPPLNAHLRGLAVAAGAEYRYSSPVERVELSEEAGEESPPTPHRVHCGDGTSVLAHWVLDTSGRRCVLGRQLGAHQPLHLQPAGDNLDTAAVWNRFDHVIDDPEVWKSFRGIDRRRQTVHASGPGFWIWWIHQNAGSTSVGVTWDRTQHSPDVKGEDRGFWEMIGKFPAIANLLAGARAKEPFQYLAHLPYRSTHFVSPRRYALIGDAAWFVDALYSIGLETSCRMTVNVADLIVRSRASTAGTPPPAKAEYDRLNDEFDHCCESVIELNRFRYQHAWKDPQLVWQTSVFELGEIAELYHFTRKQDWRPELLSRFYRLQWNSRARKERLEAFHRGALASPRRPPRGLIKKGLIPGRLVYLATWLMWQVPAMMPLFFRLVRAWAYSERLALRTPLWPDGLRLMAGPPPKKSLPIPALAERMAGQAAASAHPSRAAV